MICNYCGCEEYDIIARYTRLEKNNILQCKNCGLVYLEIKKDKKEIESFYSSSEYRKDATMPVQSAEEHFYDKVTQHDTENWIQFISNNIDIGDKKILEIGSASGSLLEKLSEYGAKEAIGIELDKEYSKFAHLFCAHLADKYFKARTGKLLDVCCGHGEHMEIFSSLGFDAYGVDKESVAKGKSLKVKIADVDLEDIPYPDNYFDFIMMKSAIEHIRNVYHLTENLYRVLKPGGKIVIITCDWKAVHKFFYLDVDPKTPFMKCSLHDLMMRYDFKNVNVEYFYHLPYTWHGRFFRGIAGLIRFLIPIDFPPTVKLNFIVKQIKFARDKQILGYGEKKLNLEDDGIG